MHQPTTTSCRHSGVCLALKSETGSETGSCFLSYLECKRGGGGGENCEWQLSFPLFPWRYKRKPRECGTAPIYNSEPSWMNLNYWGAWELLIALLLWETTEGRQAHNKHGEAITVCTALHCGCMEQEKGPLWSGIWDLIFDTDVSERGGWGGGGGHMVLRSGQ